MYVKDVAFGQVVLHSATNAEEVILGIHWGNNALESYAYDGASLDMCLVTYPYTEDIFQRSLELQLIQYRNIDDLSITSYPVLNKNELNLWITKSILHNPSLVEYMIYCKTDVNKVKSYLVEEHKKFLNYRNNCRQILKENKKNKYTNLKIGELYRSSIEDTYFFIYLGKNLCLCTDMFSLNINEFVLSRSVAVYLEYKSDIATENYRTWYDTTINLCDFPYNKRKIKELVTRWST